MLSSDPPLIVMCDLGSRTARWTRDFNKPADSGCPVVSETAMDERIFFGGVGCCLRQKIAEEREEGRQQKNCGHRRGLFFPFSKLR
jgi:hypothetical protein